MKIARIDATVIAVPYDHGGARPPSGWRAMETLYVRVETDDGAVGWGEGFGFAACATTKRAIDDLVAPLAVGQEVSDVGNFMAGLRRRLHNSGRDGPVMFAISALDIALWDLAGQAAGQPVWQLLGGDAPDSLPVYASLLRYADPDNCARNAAAAVARGHREIKLHEVGLAEIAAGREAIGAEIPMTVDANCAWLADEAVAMAQKMAAFDLTWLEEPVYPPDNYAGLARVRTEGGVPVAAGENNGTLGDFARLVDSAGPDYLQPSVTKVGGISVMLEISRLADERGAALAPHSPYFGPGLIATIHLLAAGMGRPVLERFYCDLEASPLGEAVVAKDGRIAVPRGPGLGVAVDEAVIDRYRV